MIKPQTLKGFRDFLPQEAKKRQYAINKLKTVFESFGFEPLETPALEYEEILRGKYGEEGDLLMYRFEDNGKRRVAMRYDQTVPLARVVAQYQNDLPTPFKRYQIQPVFRAENTQKGRYREFLQCDADIVGPSSPLADAEIIITAAKALEALGVSKFKIFINDRSVLNIFSIEEIRVLDKLKKIEIDGVAKELVEKKLANSLEEAKSKIEKIRNESAPWHLQEIFNNLENLGLQKEEYEFSPTLARGLDYYTGVIFEIEIDGYIAGSVCGGGRYDKLIGMFANSQIPAVGFAFGFDRVIEAMEQLNLFPADLANSVTQVLVTIFSEDLKQKSLETVSKLREQNINTELYLGEIKEKNPLEKQLKYADQKQIPYVIIIGPEENQKSVVTLKNLQTREQSQKPLEEIIDELKI